MWFDLIGVFRKLFFDRVFFMELQNLHIKSFLEKNCPAKTRIREPKGNFAKQIAFVSCVWILYNTPKEDMMRPNKPQCWSPKSNKIWAVPKTISNCEDPYTLYSTNQLTQTNQGKKTPTWAPLRYGPMAPKAKEKVVPTPTHGCPRISSDGFFGWIFTFVFLVETKNFEVQIFVWFLFSCLIALVKTCLCFFFSCHILEMFSIRRSATRWGSCSGAHRVQQWVMMGDFLCV